MCCGVVECVLYALFAHLVVLDSVYTCVVVFCFLFLDVCMMRRAEYFVCGGGWGFFVYFIIEFFKMVLLGEL